MNQITRPSSGNIQPVKLESYIAQNEQGQTALVINLGSVGPSQQPIQQSPTPVYPAQIQSQQHPQNRNYAVENFMFPIAAILTLFAVCGLFQLNGILSARQTPTINIQPQQPIYQPSPARY